MIQIVSNCVNANINTIGVQVGNVVTHFVQAFTECRT